MSGSTTTNHDMIVPVADVIHLFDPEDPGPLDSGIRISNITFFKDVEGGPKYNFDITIVGFHPVEWHINYAPVG
jgi:hypothetical protein